MASLNHRAALVATVAVWLTAAGSAGALTYVLNRPLELRPSVSEASAIPSPTRSSAEPAIVGSALESRAFINIPTITIKAAPPRPVRVAPVPREPRDIAKMNCTDWRQLDMGSGRVQICE
jgi:hypothetical protein